MHGLVPEMIITYKTSNLILEIAESHPEMTKVPIEAKQSSSNFSYNIKCLWHQPFFKNSHILHMKIARLMNFYVQKLFSPTFWIVAKTWIVASSVITLCVLLYSALIAEMCQPHFWDMTWTFCTNVQVMVGIFLSLSAGSEMQRAKYFFNY